MTKGERTLKVRGVPLWAVKEYLKDLGAELRGNTAVNEDGGWRAELKEGAGLTQNSSLPLVEVRIEGRGGVVKKVEKRLELKCLRVGG